jgi:N-acetylmuramoyl-L-alanine amidase
MSEGLALERDLDVLTKTMYGEARGEYQKLDVGVKGLIAVGNVVINRWRTPNHFGKTIYETCLEPYQFSCWNQNDPNFQIISRGNLDHCRIFRLCKDWAERMLQEEGIPDLTFGANHYYASSMEKLPKWAVGQQPTLTLGGHIFYKL